MKALDGAPVRRRSVHQVDLELTTDVSPQAEADAGGSAYDETSAELAGWFSCTIMDLVCSRNFELLSCTILISSLFVIDGKWMLFLSRGSQRFRLKLFTVHCCLM